MDQPAESGTSAAGRTYPWVVVGLLWFCGFFNYADRQAVNSVFPLLEREFQLSDDQLGMLGSAFMVVYALDGAVRRVRRRPALAPGADRRWGWRSGA